MDDESLKEKIFDIARWRAITDEDDREWLADQLLQLIKQDREARIVLDNKELRKEIFFTSINQDANAEPDDTNTLLEIWSDDLMELLVKRISGARIDQIESIKRRLEELDDLEQHISDTAMDAILFDLHNLKQLTTNSEVKHG